MAEFWDQTPTETYLAIDAWLERDRHTQRQQIVLAWRIAMMTRAKKLPPLKQLLAAGPAKPLKGPELQRRRREFADMTAGLDVSKLGEQMKKGNRNG